MRTDMRTKTVPLKKLVIERRNCSRCKKTFGVEESLFINGVCAYHSGRDVSQEDQDALRVLGVYPPEICMVLDAFGDWMMGVNDFALSKRKKSLAKVTAWYIDVLTHHRGGRRRAGD